MLLTAPLFAGCSGTPEIFSTDLKDADWFSRSGRLFIKSVSIETPPLTPDRPVAADDLISAEGQCPGMAPADAPGDANALAATASAGSRPGIVALGHTECDVARGAGAPDNVNLSRDGAGRRVALLTYAQGTRAGIYTFTSGRLTSVERVSEPAGRPQNAKSRARKKPSAT